MDEEELEENKENIQKPLVKIAYGDDDPTKSTSKPGTLTDPSIKIIIAPTIGMLAARCFRIKSNVADRAWAAV